MKIGIPEKFARWLTATLVLAIIIGGACFARPHYLRAAQLRGQNEELRERIAECERETAQLISYQKRFKTDRDFIEQIARQNKRVFPGEIVFIFEKE